MLFTDIIFQGTVQSIPVTDIIIRGTIRTILVSETTIKKQF